VTVPAVEFDDLELMLCGWLRPRLAQWSPLIDRLFPAPGWVPGFAVVVRDDSGIDRSLITASRSIGLTCIGAEHSQTRQLAERVATIMRALPDTLMLPIADAAVRGPYSLDATGRAEFYLTADLVAVGHTVTI
jgi:hypothetical protein